MGDMNTGKPINILLVGLGSIGSVYARVLEASGRAKVTAVARSNYDIYASGGVTLQTQQWGTFEGWKPHRLVRSQAEALAGNVHYDYCLLTTKALPDVTPTTSLLADAIKSNKIGAWAVMQNGVGVEEELYQAVKQLDTPVLSCAVWIGCNPSADGKLIIQRGDAMCVGLYPPPKSPAISRGETRTAPPRDQEAVDTFVGLIKDGGATVFRSDEMDAIRYSKNVVNCVWASFQTLARSMPYVWADLDESVTQPLKDCVREIVDVGFQTGLLREGMIQYPMGTKIESRESFAAAVWGAIMKMAVENRKKTGGGHKMSMLVDAEADKPIEVEVIVGAVVRIARENQIKTPLLDLVYALLKGLQISLIEKQAQAKPRDQSAL